MRKNDIKVAGNMIGGRQGWAYICNSGKFAVLKCDHTAKQEYKEYHTWKNVKVRLAWNYCGNENYDNAYLAWDGQHGEGQYEFAGGGAMLKASFDMHDALEMIDNANAPIIRANDIVAIAHIFNDSVAVSLYRVGRIDIHCSTKATMKMLTEDEMNEVKQNADRWCNR